MGLWDLVLAGSVRKTPASELKRAEGMSPGAEARFGSESIVPGLEQFACRCSAGPRSQWAFSSMKTPRHALFGIPSNRQTALKSPPISETSFSATCKAIWSPLKIAPTIVPLFKLYAFGMGGYANYFWESWGLVCCG